MDRDSREDQSLGDNMKAGEPLMERAVQALRGYHEAQETQSDEKMEELRLERGSVVRSDSNRSALLSGIACRGP